MKLLKGLAMAIACVVGLYVCILLWQVSGAVRDIKQDVHAVSGEAVSTLRAANAPCMTARSAQPQCGLLPQAALAIQSVNAAVGSAQTTIQTANETLRLVNRPCLPAPCGTLADVNRTLNTFRMTAGQVEIAANHEDKNLTTLDAQEASIFSDTNKTLKDADTLVASPYIAASLQSIADGTKQADGTLTDLKFEADKYIHPTKKKLGFWGSIWAGVEVARKFEPPLF